MKIEHDRIQSWSCIFSKTSMTYKIIKIKIGQRSKGPISIEQLMALNVHTNQQKLNISKQLNGGITYG